MDKKAAVEALSAVLELLTTESRVARRRALVNDGFKAMRALVEALPPANEREASEAGIQAGLLRSISLAKEARAEHESAAGRAQDVAGSAYGVMNGVRLYGQAIGSTFEAKVQHELMESLRRMRTPAGQSSAT